MHYRYVMSNATRDSVTQGYPSYIYLSEDDAQTVLDLSTMIRDHVLAESAKFVVGSRPLTEFDAFRDELRNMDVEEYVGIYASAVE